MSEVKLKHDSTSVELFLYAFEGKQSDVENAVRGAFADAQREVPHINPNDFYLELVSDSYNHRRYVVKYSRPETLDEQQARIALEEDDRAARMEREIQMLHELMRKHPLVASTYFAR